MRPPKLCKNFVQNCAAQHISADLALIRGLCGEKRGRFTAGLLMLALGSAKGLLRSRADTL